MEQLLNLKLITSSGIQKMDEIGLLPFLFILLCSLVTSFLISHLYIRFYGSKGTGSTLHRSFPLLGVAITAIFVCLQFSIPLSLGLLGALSIVRFRTPIKDPEEVGFILLIIASSITCATFNISFLLLILSVSILGLIILKKDFALFKKSGSEGVIILNMEESIYHNNAEKIVNLMSQELKNIKIDNITESSEGCALSYLFTGFDESQYLILKQKLGELSKDIQLNVFFNQSNI